MSAILAGFMCLRYPHIMNPESHYDATYFAEGRDGFEFGGWANINKFASQVHEHDTVLDFGCSGGYLLDQIRCGRKIGVELNAVPRDIAARKGIETHERTDTVADSSVDVVISNHVLEHTVDPLRELITLRAKLKPGGKLVVVVPCEGLRTSYKPQSSDFHLFTWSPMTLGNLLTAAGYEVVESRSYIHKWPPRVHRKLAEVGGRTVFDFVCRIYGQCSRGISQVRAVAHT